MRVFFSIYLFFCVFNLNTFAQNNVFNFKESDVILSTDLITIRALSVECFDSVYNKKTNDVILEIRNKTDKLIEISFVQKLYYDGNCITCNNANNSYKLKLDAHNYVLGSCSEATNYDFLRLKGCYRNGNQFEYLSGYRIKLLDSKILN